MISNMGWKGRERAATKSTVRTQALMSTAANRFAAGFAGSTVVAVLLNALPYIRTHGQNIETTGFPFTFRRLVGYGDVYEFHAGALLADVVLSLVAALLIAYACQRTIAGDPVGFWERHRLIYNAVLAFIVLLGFALAWPRSAKWLHRPALPTFVEWALLANLAYCSAYLMELLFHFSSNRDRWQHWRKALFVAGVLLASGLAVICVGVIWIGPMSN